MCAGCAALRYDSSGESATDKPLGRAGSYTRRETRLAALSKEEQDSSSKDYKKVVNNHPRGIPVLQRADSSILTTCQSKQILVRKIIRFVFSIFG